MKNKSPAELLMEIHLKELGIHFEREYKFCKLREWRADFFLSRANVLLEIEGSIYTNGRHTRGKGYQADLDKYNQAMALDYKLFRFSTQDVLRGRAKAFLKEHLVEKFE